MRFIVVFLVGFLLAACSATRTFVVEHESIPVDSDLSSSRRIDSIVEPYRSGLQSEMEQVIAQAKNDFTKGRPNGPLNNWACDAVLENQADFCKGKTVMCLLNVGGLRNPLSMGDITIGDIFKLMPFDNEVVRVEMPISSLNEINAYIIDRNGEPIGGAYFKNGELKFVDGNNDRSTFWIITSDYLLGGGDNMEFFKKNVKSEYANILLRDLFIEEAKKQGELIFNDEKRIEF